MKKTTRKVRDLESDERRLYETVLGQRLRDSQVVVIDVVTPAESSDAIDDAISEATAKLPAWCNVYEGLSEEDIADVERVALRRSDMTRPS